MNDLNVSATPNPKNPNDISFGRRQLDLNAQKEQEIEQRKREEKVFSSYFQLNKKALPLLDLCLAEKPKAFRLLMFIINHMNKRNYVECSRSVFEKALFSEINRATPTGIRSSRYSPSTFGFSKVDTTLVAISENISVSVHVVPSAKPKMC